MKSLGIPQRTAGRYAKDKAEEIRSKRDEAIIALHKEGKTERSIVEALSIGRMPVRATLNAYKEDSLVISATGEKTQHEETEEASLPKIASGENRHPVETKEVPLFFPEDDEDDEPVVNPADAYKEDSCHLSASGEKDTHRLSKVPETFCT